MQSNVVSHTHATPIYGVVILVAVVTLTSSSSEVCGQESQAIFGQSQIMVPVTTLSASLVKE